MTGHPLWLGAEPLVLASGSAARRTLLESAGLPIRVCPATIDERLVERHLLQADRAPAAVALALAQAKALAVAASMPSLLVLGADQTLSHQTGLFHKPGSPDEARRQIAALAGSTHRLDSAVALVQDGTVLFETVVQATLTMRRLSDDFIARYVAMMGDEVGDSVGGYKLEGLGIHLFERIEGDHSTILGLPLLPVLHALRGLGALSG